MSLQPPAVKIASTTGTASKKSDYLDPFLHGLYHFLGTTLQNLRPSYANHIRLIDLVFSCRRIEPFIRGSASQESMCTESTLHLKISPVSIDCLFNGKWRVTSRRGVTLSWVTAAVVRPRIWNNSKFSQFFPIPKTSLGFCSGFG